MKQSFLWAIAFFSVAGIAHAGVPANLPQCGVGDPRTPVKVWTPAFTKGGDLTSDPDAKDGEVFYIEFSREDRDYGCSSGKPDALHSLSYLPDQLAVNLRGNDQFANGYCYVSGYFLNHQVFGMHQGWTETYFEPLQLKEVALSQKYCLAAPKQVSTPNTIRKPVASVSPLAKEPKVCGIESYAFLSMTGIWLSKASFNREMLSSFVATLKKNPERAAALADTMESSLAGLGTSLKEADSALARAQGKCKF